MKNSFVGILLLLITCTYFFISHDDAEILTAELMIKDVGGTGGGDYQWYNGDKCALFLECPTYCEVVEPLAPGCGGNYPLYRCWGQIEQTVRCINCTFPDPENKYSLTGAYCTGHELIP